MNSRVSIKWQSTLNYFIKSFLNYFRVDCISKVKAHEADFEALEPEDMYIAAQMSDKDFTVFKEIRTKEEPQGKSTLQFLFLITLKNTVCIPLLIYI